MPGLSSSLNIGLSALQASQSALNVVGHNIANINTPGYSRQQIALSSADSETFGNLKYGMGVTVAKVFGVRDRFLDMQITQSTARQAGADTRYAGLEGISPLFLEEGGSGLGTLVQNFFQSFQELASRPEDRSVRTNVVGRAQILVDGLKSRYQMLTDQRTQADRAVLSRVDEINTITRQIAELNVRVATEPSEGADSDARDQRKALSDQLAGLVGVQVFEDDRGRLQITLDGGGGVLVAGEVAYQLRAVPDAALEGYNRVEVSLGMGTWNPVTDKIKEGALGGALDLRDNLLAGYQRRLDELAAGLSGQVNLIHRTGYALDGTTTGLDFFQGAVANGASGLPPGITAATHYRGMVNALSVNGAIAGDNALIAAASAGGAPGNNGAARAMAALEGATASVDTNGDGVGDSGPFGSVIAGLANTVGLHTESFRTRGENDQNLLLALQTQRDRVSGVDLDEEATALMTYQRGYQASARFISVINQLTDQLVNQFGR